MTQKPPTLGNALIFHPLAWLELKWFLLHKPVEVSCMGIAEIPEHPLYVTRLAWLPQNNSAGFVEFHDGAFSTHFNDCLDRGLQPYQATRIWIHTHPGGSPHPSGRDEQQLKDLMALNDWTVMFIMARTGATYCRLRMRETVTTKGIFGSVATERRHRDQELEVSVAWNVLREPREIDPVEWAATFDRNMHLDTLRSVVQAPPAVVGTVGKARPRRSLSASMLPIQLKELAKNDRLRNMLRASLPANLALKEFCDLPPNQQAAILETSGFTFST